MEEENKAITLNTGYAFGGILFLLVSTACAMLTGKNIGSVSTWIGIISFILFVISIWKSNILKSM